MTSLVVVNGLPETIKVPKLIFGLKNALKKKANVRKFWIKGVADVRGTNLKSATLEFYTPEDTYNGMRALNGYEYPWEGNIYPLAVQLEEPPRRSPSPFRYRSSYERENFRGGYSGSRYARSRSRSPLHDDPRQIDLELELLRKKRMIIEEERKLLIEKKKLELLKECDDLRDLGRDHILRDEFEWRDRRRRVTPPRRHSPPRRRASSPPHQRRPPPPRIRNPPFHKNTPPKKEKPPYNERLPNFYSSCNIILGDMRETIKQITPKEHNNEMYKILRTLIRQRLTECVGVNRHIVNDAKEIVKIYREAHPRGTDEYFVKDTLVGIESGPPADQNSGVPEMKGVDHEQEAIEASYQNIDTEMPLYDSGEMNRADYLEGNPGEGGSELSMDGYEYGTGAMDDGGSYVKANQYQGGYEREDYQQNLP